MQSLLRKITKTFDPFSSLESYIPVSGFRMLRKEDRSPEFHLIAEKLRSLDFDFFLERATYQKQGFVFEATLRYDVNSAMRNNVDLGLLPYLAKINVKDLSDDQIQDALKIEFIGNSASLEPSSRSRRLWLHYKHDVYVGQLFVLYNRHKNDNNISARKSNDWILAVPIRSKEKCLLSSYESKFEKPRKLYSGKSKFLSLSLFFYLSLSLSLCPSLFVSHTHHHTDTDGFSVREDNIGIEALSLLAINWTLKINTCKRQQHYDRMTW